VKTLKVGDRVKIISLNDTGTVSVVYPSELNLIEVNIDHPENLKIARLVGAKEVESIFKTYYTTLDDIQLILESNNEWAKIWGDGAK